MNALSYSCRSTEGSEGSAYSHAYIRPREKKQVKSLSRMATLCVLLLLLAVPAFAAELTVNKIVAVVNGEMITLHDLRGPTAAELSRRGLSPDDPQAQQIMRQVLDVLINNILLRQEAERMKVVIGNQDVEAEVKKFVQRSGLSQTSFEAQLKKQGSDMDGLRKRIRDTFLRQRMMHFMVARKVVISPDEVDMYYNAHKDEFAGEKTADFSLIAFKPGVKPENIVAQIKSGSISFEEAAAQYSLDPSGQKAGGRVEMAPWKALGPGMRKTLEGLKDGELSALIPVQGTKLVLRRNAVSEGKALSLQEARPRIEEILREPRLEERFREYSQQLRDKAVIDIRL